MLQTKTNTKINLGLRVLSKRPDGFHNLETLFVPWDGMGDDLSIEEANDFSICVAPASTLDAKGSAPICDWDPLDDLCAKAWRLLHQEFDIPPVNIQLIKSAPVGAGLGGGSADAAATLCLLNQLFSLGLDKSELAQRASRLGSDCAFFIYNRPMFGTSRGEILSPYDIDLSAYDIRVALPEGIAVSTAQAYKGVLASRNRDSMPIKEALACPIEQWKEVLVNDFESTIFPLYPQIADLKKSFYNKGAVYASMSGSGSAVFGLWKKSSSHI